MTDKDRPEPVDASGDEAAKAPPSGESPDSRRAEAGSGAETPEAPAIGRPAADSADKDSATAEPASPDPAPDEPAPDEPAHDEPASDEPEGAPSAGRAHHDEHDEGGRHEGESRSFSAIALQALVLLLLGGALALWAGPRIAPHLPAWAAPAAEFLTPGADRISGLRAETDALAERVSAVEADARRAAEAAADDGGAAAAAEARLSARIDELAAALDARPAGDGGALQDLSARVDALEAAPPPAPSGAAPAGAASLDAEIVQLLRKDVSRIDDMATKKALDAVEARVGALESGEAATADARSEAERIRREANLDAALTRVRESLSIGAPYARPLGAAVSLSGVAAPDALSALSETGAATVAELSRTFPQAARKGYAASIEAKAGDSFADRLISGVSSRIGGRPATETPGDDAGAVLSRVEARLNEGRLTAAADQAAALPPASAAAMGAWLGRLERAAAAERAYGEWRAALGRN